jgi:hypothetical protein
VPYRLRYEQNTISLAAILKLKIAANTKSVNIINNALNGFLVPENVGFDTKFKRLCGLEQEIYKNYMFTGGHFKIQDGDRGNKWHVWNSSYQMSKLHKHHSLTNCSIKNAKIHNSPDK